MKFGETFWTDYDPLESGSSNEDPLGFYAYAMRLAEEWLPGITTRTRRIRYYSMVCGGLHLIESALSHRIAAAENKDAERTALFLRWERLWAVMNAADEEQDLRGLIGRKKASTMFKNGGLKGASVDFTLIQRQPDLGGLGAYRTSLQAFGLMRGDCVELTADGRHLAEMFWEQHRSIWKKCVWTIETGRMRLPRARRKLARIAAMLGIQARRQGSDSNAVHRDELRFLRDRLLPDSGGQPRRTEVLEYLRRRGLSDEPEWDILTSAARRTNSGGGTPLERRAAAIVALENFKLSLLDILNLFRIHLIQRGCASSPGKMPRSGELRGLTSKARVAQRKVLRFSDSPEFQHVFKDFSLGKDLVIGEGSDLIERLLDIHMREMRQRRSPRWFHPSSSGRWELDSSMAFHPDEDARLKTYTYRTENLIRMARETGRRL